MKANDKWFAFHDLLKELSKNPELQNEDTT